MADRSPLSPRRRFVPMVSWWSVRRPHPSARGLALGGCRAALSALLAVCAALALALVLPAPGALAHAQLISSTPADGSLVDKAPASAELVFNEDVNPSFAQVIVRDQADNTVSTQAPTVDGPKVTVGLPKLPPGQVTVLFRVTSKDAHPISGKVSFTIDGQPGFAPATSASTGAVNPGSGSDQQALAAGADKPGAAAGPSGAPPTWLYVLTGLLALALIGLGSVILRRERRGHPVAGPVRPTTS